jgi:hypothetical protein
VKQEKDILLQPYPVKSKRFDCIKMPNLLNTHTKQTRSLRARYFNELAEILFEHNHELYVTPGYEVDTWTLANHLKNSLDHKYTSNEKLEDLSKLLQSSIVAQYP